MGYYKQLEISNQVEEPDRYLFGDDSLITTRRALTARRRETYRAPKHWVVRNLDMVMLFAMVPMSFALGAIVTLLVVTS